MGSGEEVSETLNFGRQAGVKVDVSASLKNSKVRFKLPFFEVGNDMLNEFRFNEGEEIVFTCGIIT